VLTSGMKMATCLGQHQTPGGVPLDASEDVLVVPGSVAAVCQPTGQMEAGE
jgi:hypothetical protein